MTVAELTDRMTGVEIDRGSWVDGRSRERVLREQSEEVARRLERMGIPARQDGPGVTVVGMCTGLADRPISYRNTNLIPAMQSRNLHEMATHLRYYFDVTPKKQLRMVVISAGWVPLTGYRPAHNALCRTISRLGAEPWLKEAGVELVFYSVENTVHRERDGQAMLNLHAHLVIRSRRRLGSTAWRNLMARIAGRAPKDYAHDGRLQKPAECVKYVFKHGELLALSDAELAELFRQTYRLKFFHPCGELRRWRRQWEEEGKRLKHVQRDDGRWEWRAVKVRRGDGYEPDPDAQISEELAAACDLLLQDGDPATRERDPEPDQVLGFTAPIPRFSPRMEPCLVVRNYTGDFEHMLAQQPEHVRERVQAARRAWEARHAAGDDADASMRHTPTTTVRPVVGTGAAIYPLPPPEPAKPPPPPPPEPLYTVDPETGEVTETPESRAARAEHAALLSPDVNRALDAWGVDRRETGHGTAHPLLRWGDGRDRVQGATLADVSGTPQG